MKSRIMDFPQKKYYWANESMLRLIGQWPYQNPWDARIRRLIIAIILWSSAIFQVMKIFILYRLDSGIILDTFSEMIMIAGAAITIFILYPGPDIFTGLLDRLRKDWISCQNIQEEIRIKEEYAKKSQKLVYYAILYSFIVYMPALAVTKYKETVYNTSHFLYEGYVPIIQNNNRPIVYRYAILLYIYASFVFSALFIIGNSTFFAALIYHSCGIFAIIGYRVEKIFDDYPIKSKCDKKRKYNATTRSLFDCIKKHQDAIDFLALIELHYFPCIFGIFFFVISVLSVTMVLALDVKSIPIKQTAFTVGQIFFFGILCYLGQMIINKTEEVSIQMYNSKWYYSSVYHQRILLFILHRANTPYVFNKSQFFILTFEKLREVLRLAVSSCMVLRNLQNA